MTENPSLSPHVLIVEDSQTQAMLLEQALLRKGLQVDLARNGEEALAKLRKNRPDVMISDVTMPGMTGYELCKAVRAEKDLKSLPIILFTALSNTKEMIEGVASGADYFLTKPSDPDTIIHYVKNCISKEENPEDLHPITFIWEDTNKTITTDLNKFATLFLSTYNNVVEKNKTLERVQHVLKAQNTELALLNEQKNKFLGMATHDLRNPLAVIISFCDILMDEVEEKKIVISMKNSAEKMLRLVNELLDVSVIESGKQTLKITDCDLKSLFENVVALTRSIAENKGISIKLSIDKNMPKILCDANKIEQVLVNFITNAIKYSPSKTLITVRLFIKDFQCQFEVIDQGPGILKEEKQKLFRSFSKLSSKTTGGEQSIGLGLTIAKKIIEEHGGEIGCRSEFGKGATFFAKLPLKSAEGSFDSRKK